MDVCVCPKYENKVLSLNVLDTSNLFVLDRHSTHPLYYTSPGASEMNCAQRLTGQMPFHLNASHGWIPIQHVPADNLIQHW